MGHNQQKNHEKKKNKTHKKEKILVKLVVGKEKKRFDVIVYCIIDDTIGDEYLG